MNSNWFKLVMKMIKVEYGKNLLLKGVPIIFNKGDAKLKIGENVTIKSNFLSNLVGLYSRTIIVTRAPGAEIEIGDNVKLQIKVKNKEENIEMIIRKIMHAQNKIGYFKEIEIIDENSSDETYEILKKIEKQYSNIKVEKML